MSHENEELIQEFIVESNEHLADIENELLAIEAAGADVDTQLVNKVFRALHSIKGASGFLDLTTIQKLSHSVENVLNRIRNFELVADSAVVELMLRATDHLRNLLADVFHSNEVDVSEWVDALDAIALGNSARSQGAEEVLAAEESSGLPAQQIDELSDSLLRDMGVPANPSATDAAASAEAARAAMPPTVLPTPGPANTPPVPRATSRPSATDSTTREATGKASPNSVSTTTVRVAVQTLDLLMNLAGELVLARNQLVQAMSSKDTKSLDSVAGRLDQVTSDLQESIMQTRMQPVANVFTKFPRIVRDLAQQLGKQCKLITEGEEVELDRTIIEAINDPLTHLIRNAVDHGIESPEARRSAGKDPAGTVILRAFHEGGTVNISIEDDGAGINPERIKKAAVEKGVITAQQAREMSDREAVRLIFHAGFSTAEKVTDVSGRGVGMDVVKSNLERIGGTVEIETEVGLGTEINIKLPLTLAIIPSLIVCCGKERFAIPQVSIRELVRISHRQGENRIQRIKGAEVLRLRGRLLPLVRLEEALGRVPKGACLNEPQQAKAPLNVIVMESGQGCYGLVVDALRDSEEIVVKPLGRHMKDCMVLAGATILGDGQMAPILDEGGIARYMGLLERLGEHNEQNASAQASQGIQAEGQSLLLFRNHSEERFALPMAAIAHIDRTPVSKLRRVAGQMLLERGDDVLPLILLEEVLQARAPQEKEHVFVVVAQLGQHEVGLVAPELEDIRQVSTNIEQKTVREDGVQGTVMVEGVTTRLLDLPALARRAMPHLFAEEVVLVTPVVQGKRRIMVVEDSGFFREQLRKLLVEEGYEVVACVDGEDAWQQLQSGQSVQLVVTDIEMPRVDGYELTRRIKTDARLQSIPVIALSSLAGSADLEKGYAAGVDEYQVKLQKEQLLEKIRSMSAGQAATTGA